MLGLSLKMLSFKSLIETNTIGKPPESTWKCIQAWRCWMSDANFDQWTQVMVVMWCSMTVARWAVYIPVQLARCHTPADVRIKTCNYYVSDHIWLISSLVAQLQTVFSVLAMAAKTEKSKWRIYVPMLIGWTLIMWLCIETFITARYWHTTEAVWAAALTGLCFQLPVWWWLGRLEESADKKDNLLAEDLLPTLVTDCNGPDSKKGMP